WSQRRDTQRGMPEEKEDQCHHGGFEQPDGEWTEADQHSVMAAHMPEKEDRCRQNAENHGPNRPWRQEHKLPFMENTSRVLEQDFKHEVHDPRVWRCQCRRGSDSRELQTIPM